MIRIYPLLFFALNLCAQNPSAVIANGDQFYCPGQLPIVKGNVEISDPSDPSRTSLDALYIQISSGYERNSDSLYLAPNLFPNITSSFNTVEGKLTLSGPAVFSEFEAAVENVIFENSEGALRLDKTIVISIGDANYLPNTDHFYKFVDAPLISWTDSKAAAENLPMYFGRQGYLTTITSEVEAAFVGEQSPYTGWIGGTDNEAYGTSEGRWIWATGPEEGTVFWNGQVNGSSPTYANWSVNPQSPEPNNYGGENNGTGGEDYAHVADPVVAQPFGSWNDLPNSGGAAGTPYEAKGFVVEFGGMPGDNPVDIIAEVFIKKTEFSVLDETLCGSGSVTLSGTSNTGDLYWYDTASGGSLLQTGLSYQSNYSVSTSVWVTPLISCDTQRHEVKVTVNPLPDYNTSRHQIIQCDFDSDRMDGQSAFNLFFEEDVLSITNGIIANRTVKFYNDALGTVPITDSEASNFINTVSNPQIVYAKVIDTNTLCESAGLVAVELFVENASISNGILIDLKTCDINVSSIPIGEFDLNDSQLDPITVNVTPPYTLRFYESEDDATLQLNPINSNLIYESQSKAIFARVENDSGFCVGISEINLLINPLPELYDDINEDNPYLICNDGIDEVELYALKESQDPTSTYIYTWFDETGTIVGNKASFVAKSSGKYEAFVEKLYAGTSSSCLSIRKVYVENSSVAQVEQIVVEDLSDNNSIFISVSGDGDYTFALNQGGFFTPDSDNPFQFQFTNVPAGIHTVKVRDEKNNCGTIEIEVPVIGFPKFMTPNADNKNDTWNVVGLNANNQKATTISVFDRYGKLLSSYTADQLGWDGTHKGKPLPANDYWYLIKLYNEKIYRGHFTLVR